MGVNYELLDGEQARLLVPHLVGLYALVYAEPPYEEGPEQVKRFAETLPDELDRDGFALTAATIGDRLAGAAYGWTMDAGRWWSHASAEPPADLKESPKFAIMEWMVHPQHRGHGIGRALMQHLLGGRPEPWATLASDPRSAARGMYTRAGWRQVGESTLSWGPAMDLLALPLDA